MKAIAATGVGTYVLVLCLEQPTTVPIGKSGAFLLPAGFYTYVGSAMGSGGLRARLGHHLRLAPRPHWHIDYLRQFAAIQQIWLLESPVRREHEWAKMLGDMPGAMIVIPRFGASDCHCASHLHHFRNQPIFSEFRNQNARRFPGDGPLSIIPMTS